MHPERDRERPALPGRLGSSAGEIETQFSGMPGKAKASSSRIRLDSPDGRAGSWHLTPALAFSSSELCSPKTLLDSRSALISSFRASFCAINSALRSRNSARSSCAAISQVASAILLGPTPGFTAENSFFLDFGKHFAHVAQLVEMGVFGGPSTKAKLQESAEVLRAEREDAMRAAWEKADAHAQHLLEALAERDQKLRTQGRKIREGVQLVAKLRDQVTFLVDSKAALEQALTETQGKKAMTDASLFAMERKSKQEMSELMMKIDTAAQLAEMADMTKKQLKSELAAARLEISRLTSTLDSRNQDLARCQNSLREAQAEIEGGRLLVHGVIHEADSRIRNVEAIHCDASFLRAKLVSLYERQLFDAQEDVFGAGLPGVGVEEGLRGEHVGAGRSQGRWVGLLDGFSVADREGERFREKSKSKKVGFGLGGRAGGCGGGQESQFLVPGAVPMMQESAHATMRTSELGRSRGDGRREVWGWD